MMTEPPPATVAVLYAADSDQSTRVDVTQVTRDWLQRQLDGARTLEAMPCEEDALTDDHYQPLWYVIVNAEGYTQNLARNWCVERALPDTVKIHTRLPTTARSDAYVGLYGNAVQVPRAYVPADALPTWSRVSAKS